MFTFKGWTVMFPGKMGMSWKRASWSVDMNWEEAEIEAAKHTNTVAVPVELCDHIKEIEHRLVAAERKLIELGIRQDYKDGEVTYKELK